MLPEIETYEFSTALSELVRVHLGSYGPATREDLSFFFGTTLRAVIQPYAISAGDIVHMEVDLEEKHYLDLADAPTDGQEDPGLRLLPEFDGLFVGYAGTNRTRIPDRPAAAVGLGQGQRHVLTDRALWRAHRRHLEDLAVGKDTAIEVRMLDPHRPTLSTCLPTPSPRPKKFSP